MKFDEHINNITSSANKRIGIIINTNCYDFLILYKACIIMVSLHGVHIWESIKLEFIQGRATRVILSYSKRLFLKKMTTCTIEEEAISCKSLELLIKIDRLEFENIFSNSTTRGNTIKLIKPRANSSI